MFKKAFVWPSFQNKRVVVIGMGGGCDVFSAFSLHKLLQRDNPNGTFTFGNCVGTRDSLADHPQLTTHLYAPGAHKPLPPGSEDGKNTYGTTLLERSIPQSTSKVLLHHDDSGSIEGTTGPLIFEVPLKKGDVDTVTQTNTAALVHAWKWLQADVVIGVDNGGDSLTFGVDFKDGKPELGRDYQVLSALRSSQLPFFHVVFGPGCDGESTQEAMEQAVTKLDATGNLCGYLHIGDNLGVMKEEGCPKIGATRTPHIMWAAADAAKDECKTGEEDTKMVLIDRMTRPTLPRCWLYHGLVFTYGEANATAHL
eukprot:TRINITY_DN54747_c0_g1_i1.p1 TRINITY_DN54747_c0_g1~~TRINITY_DN54747_c0_g1_i1.p1  ORF type:complete len:329 (+),score=31.04 TRINITY_DN54747_c0_g1_i1:60-989(+)